MSQCQELSPSKKVIQLIDSQEDAISAACSGGVSFPALRSALGAAMIRNPEIVQCTSASIVMACLCAAKLGIDPTGMHNSAHFEIRNNKQKGGGYAKELQLQIGYGGLIELVKRSGDIVDVFGEVVYDGELFDFVRGKDKEPIHQIDFAIRNAASHQDVVGAYAVFKYKNGDRHVEVLDRREIARSRDASKNKQDWGPWAKDLPAMAVKTVIRKGCKYLVLDRVGHDGLAVSDKSDGYDLDNVPRRSVDNHAGDIDLADALVSPAAAELPVPMPDPLKMMHPDDGCVPCEPERDPDTNEIIPDYIG